MRQLYPRSWRVCLRARYIAEQHEIAARYAEFELIESPEIPEVNPGARYFRASVPPKAAREGTAEES